MTPHIIRLRGPWQWTPLSRTRLLADGQTRDEEGDLPAGGVCHPPFDWRSLLGDFRGRVAFSRRFGRPSGLGNERVLLELGGLDAIGSATLNERVLGELGERPARFDVGELLEARNCLAIEVELPRLNEQSADFHHEGRGLLGEVALAIHEAAP